MAPRIIVLAALLALSACKGVGLSQLDTISEEDRQEEKWWKDYYGEHCATCDTPGKNFGW